MTTRTLIAMFSVAALCGWHQAVAFECPRPQTASPSVISQTPQDQQALSQAFSASDIENQIGVAVADLQRKYPGVTDSELLNYLIGEYCPVVARMPGLSDAQKTAKVEHFAATVFELLSEQKL